MASKKNQELYLASARGEVDLVRQLIAQGADPNAITKGRTALHAAASSAKTEVIPVLVSANADLNALNDDRLTPLMCACSVGKVKGSKAALLLIELGADVTYVRKSDDATAIMLAVPRASLEVFQKLVEHGAAVDGPRGTDITPLMVAAIENSVVAAQALISLGADVNRKCKLPWAKGQTAEEIAIANKRSAVAALLAKARVTSKVKK